MLASIIVTQALVIPLALTPATRDCDFGPTPTAVDRQALSDFARRTQEYDALHRRLERALMLDHMTWSDEEDMDAETLADAIRDARPNASAGSIFTPEIAALIKFRLERTIWLYRLDAAATPEPADAVEAPPVHGWWFGETERRDWPSVLADLPPLPATLEYRLRGRHLILVDTHANLVVDVLAHALPLVK